MVVGGDGRVHTTFSHNPSSLRLSSFDPNLQNIPRGGGSEVERWVKEIFVAPEGKVFWERDFSGIEAELVGYFCGSARYTRLAKLGVHDFLVSHICGHPADLSLPDAELKSYLINIKSEFGHLRDAAKRTVHASNYMVSPRKLQFEYPDIFPTIKRATELQNLYFDLFPEIREWHKDICLRVDGTKRRPANVGETEDITPWTMGVCYARNPFGYVHRFYNVLDWTRDPRTGEWLWEFGDDAKRLISFLPQSTAAAIIKRAAKRIYYDYPNIAHTMRLLIHDSILGEATEGAQTQVCLDISKLVMEEPIPELPLDPSWGMGEFLSIGSEAKVGKSWAAMK